MIEWSEHALRQLDQAYDFVTLSNGEEVADQIRSQIFTSVERLDTYPMLGRTGRVLGSRELVIANTSYLAAYEIQKGRIYILALYHGAQRWPEAF